MKRQSSFERIDIPLSRDVYSKYDDIKAVADDIEHIVAVSDAIAADTFENVDEVIKEPLRSSIINVGTVHEDVVRVSEAINDGTFTTATDIVSEPLRSSVIALGPVAEDIATVAANLGHIVQISGEIENVIKVGENIEDVVAVGDNIPSVVTTAGNVDGISTVANNIGNLNLIANDLSGMCIQSIEDLGSVTEDLDTSNCDGTSILELIANNMDHVDTVSTHMDSVITNADNIGLIDFVASFSDSITTNADNIDSINTNAENIDIVNIVANDLIGSCAASIDYGLVSEEPYTGGCTDSSFIETVARNMGKVTTCGDNIDDIGIVAQNIDDVSTVADNIDDIVIVRNNVDGVTYFADIWQGASAVPPATRNNGTPLQQGDLFFDTNLKVIRTYDGVQWSSGSATDSYTQVQIDAMFDDVDSDIAGLTNTVNSNKNELDTRIDGIDTSLTGINDDLSDLSALVANNRTDADAAIGNLEAEVTTLSYIVDDNSDKIERNLDVVTALASSSAIVGDVTDVALPASSETTLSFSTVEGSTDTSLINVNETNNYVTLEVDASYVLSGSFHFYFNTDQSRTVTIRGRNYSDNSLVYEETLTVIGDIGSYDTYYVSTRVQLDDGSVPAGPLSVYFTIEANDTGIALDEWEYVVACGASYSVGGSGSGSENFVGLTDTPSSYTGQSGKVLAVNSTEDGLEFVDAATDVGTIADFEAALA